MSARVEREPLQSLSQVKLCLTESLMTARILPIVNEVLKERVFAMNHHFELKNPTRRRGFLQQSPTAFSLLASIPVLVACGKGINGGPTIDVNFVASDSTTSASAGLVGDSLSVVRDLVGLQDFTASVPTAELERTGNPQNSSHGFSGTAWGSAAPTSLSYAIYQVQICEKLDVTGTAFSNPTNCASLYKMDYSQSDYDSNNVTAPYLDMMQMAATRAALNVGVTATAGTYNYGLVNWFKPIKVKGSVTLSDASVLYTKSDATYTSGGSGYYTKMNNMTSAPAEEATVQLNNGGAWFKFATPWTYDGKTAIQLDLAFTPNDVLKGSNGTSAYLARDANSGNGIDIPLLGITPIVHSSGDTASKEVYRIPTANSYMYVELYYAKSDTTKSVLGATLRTAYKTGTTATDLSEPAQAFGVTTSGTTVTLTGYDGTTLVSIPRQTTEGASTTVTVNCGGSGSYLGSPCGATTGTQSYTGTLYKIKDVF